MELNVPRDPLHKGKKRSRAKSMHDEPVFASKGQRNGSLPTAKSARRELLPAKVAAGPPPPGSDGEEDEADQNACKGGVERRQDDGSGAAGLDGNSGDGGGGRDGGDGGGGRDGGDGGGGRGDDEDEDEDNLDYEMGATFHTVAPEKMRAVLTKFTPDQMTRYECYRRSGFHRANMKRLIQNVAGCVVSVPMTIVMSGIAKLFVGDLIEMARMVMNERQETGPIRPCHMREAYRRLKNEGKVPVRSKPRLFRGQC